jgi:magnesium transporter
MLTTRLRKLLSIDKNHIGLSPDDLIHKGEKKSDEVFIRLIDFDAEMLEEDIPKTIQDVGKYKDKSTVTWINIDGLHSTEVM